MYRCPSPIKVWAVNGYGSAKFDTGTIMSLCVRTIAWDIK